nr:hypothetical protein DM860_015094 [Ipomoea batatas]
MGFDHLREQQISRIPGKLAWWLLTNFDARSCSLRVQDGKELHITEEDVALTLGFPRGNIRIEKRTKGNEDTTLVFYVDRVVLYNRPVPRQLPAFKGWSTRLLNQREKNEISLVALDTEKIKLLATTMLEVMTIAQEAPQRTVDDPNFKQMVESAQKLLGIPNPEIELTKENEEFWNNPEFIAAFDEIDNAIARREQYRAKIAERPSFNLGMTPDEVDSVIRRVKKLQHNKMLIAKNKMR